jgi:neutral trehalase
MCPHSVHSQLLQHSGFLFSQFSGQGWAQPAGWVPHDYISGFGMTAHYLQQVRYFMVSSGGGWSCLGTE